MLTANLLAKKRDGHVLSEDELRFLIDGYCSGNVADYQMSAFAMAVCVRGMTEEETAILTRCMLESGVRLPRQASGDRPRVDKHSTGGLGDKISLILAPALAACGVHVPMISGRGLGLTGGTLDKLEAIEGFRTELSFAEADRVLAQAGAFIVSANERLAPADQKLYALRDVTGTVESVPLITASILSKKLAASLDALVMDVKVGRAAFMKTPDRARALAASLQQVGSAAGLPTSVLISDMDQPLGCAVGNANEVNESVRLMQGEQDRMLAPVRELTKRLCGRLLVQVGAEREEAAAAARIETCLDDGSALERFEAMVSAQGGRWTGPLQEAPGRPLLAERQGHVHGIDCQQIGTTVVAIGGGRKKLGDPIDPAVGIRMHVRVGDRVERGQPLLTLHCHETQREEYARLLGGAISVEDQEVPARPLLFPVGAD